MLLTGRQAQTGVMPWFRRAAGALTFVLLLFGAVAAQGQGNGDDTAPAFSRQGADTCLKCHDESGDFPVLAIFQTPHAVMGDKDTPFAKGQCEACHGPGGEHGKRLRFGEERPPIPAFGESSTWSTEKENAVCRDCHDPQGHRFWQGSAHEREDLACVDCHQVHVRRDPVTVTEQQPRVCFDCHFEQRAQFQRARAHPVRQGEMECSACHDAHGSLTRDMLNRPTLNETCYQCHAEKRGPFLWEHAPASEDCSLCHQPHGSSHRGMLTQSKPLLCQSCHSRLGHPSIGRTGKDLPSGSPSGFLLSGSCSNCHSQVHGSNHPSGANLSR